MKTAQELNDALQKLSSKYHKVEYRSTPDGLWTDTYGFAYDRNVRGQLFKYNGSWYMWLNLYNNNEAGDRTASLNKASQDAWNVIASSWYMPVTQVNYDIFHTMLEADRDDRARRGAPRPAPF